MEKTMHLQIQKKKIELSKNKKVNICHLLFTCSLHRFLQEEGQMAGGPEEEQYLCVE